ncbi:NlpC/P60 family protein [Pedobacter sp.]|uniref:C40 family peptidase n=1 Tax=Pedobacter sp. TaxID=1411316 RepID=UPI003D7F1AD2
MEHHYAICRVTVAPLRAQPSDQAEIVSQLLFGDNVLVQETNDRWLYIRTVHDEYEGWVDFKQVTHIQQPEISHFLAPPQINNTLLSPDGSRYYLAASSNLPHYADGFCRIGATRFEVMFKPLAAFSKRTATDVVNFALFYEHAPYLWGGRTSFGIDCSGFVQSVYKLAGISLKRDASQQAEMGSTVDFLPEAVPGDVAFFDNEEGRIIHVGILLENDRIIHASGKVKIDPIDDQGIYSKELQRYTHKLRIIKRFI